LQFDSNAYINEELSRLLSVKYTVSIVEMPDSVLSPDGRFTAHGELRSHSNLG
jgi:hypothetical protein